jgi:CubicO group peptidase (beta-lactamase class C family)
MKILRRTVSGLLVLTIALLLFLWLNPPALLRVGANYSAKIVCSNVFLAGRDADEVLRIDVQAPGIALLRLMRVSVDREHGVVRTGLLGFIGDGLAVAKAGKGCTVLPDGKLDQNGGTRLIAVTHATAADSPPWPEGNAVKTSAAVDKILGDEKLAGPGARALVVVDHGRIVGERYAQGFTDATPLLGWSMTKSVMAGVIGLVVKDGKLKLDQTGLWSGTDGRERIRLADLLAMSSGLNFNESYGAVSDVTSMLYLQPDMAAFARSQPLIHPVGEVWSYSSGTAVILSRIAQDAVGSDASGYIKTRLFEPLGMSSALIEADEHGTLVGSSYMYATARDWARYGQFLMQGGVWQGQALLPAGYVEMMSAPVTSSHGQYGQGQVWRWEAESQANGLPKDTFWMSGHDGQYVAIVPSRQVVIVRMGLTPDSLGYAAQPLVKAVLDASSVSP